MDGYHHGGKLHFHLSFGRIIDELSSRCEKVFLCVPLKDAFPDESRDYRLKADNVEVIRQPFYTSAITSLKCFFGIARVYNRVCCQADVLFIRGMPAYVGVLYFLSWFYRRRTCHWIVGNPVKLLRTHKRAGFFMDALSVLYALQDRFFTKLGRRLVGGAFVCNGRELGKIYKSPHTIVTASSTVKEDEFLEREDTCQGKKISILFIGFIRPEKGVEYLIEAVGKLETDKDWELVLVGTYGKYHAYKTRLDLLINQYGLSDKVHWAGYVTYGQPMFEYLRKADLLVLPTLSEGTPRVLVEARANSLPLIATNVGGIPTSVTDGKDGLLVPPKDPRALSRAIERIVDDGELRRSLIKNGLHSARKMTVDRFVDLVVNVMENQT